jgi:hypothetical protein
MRSLRLSVAKLVVDCNIQSSQSNELENFNCFFRLQLVPNYRANFNGLLDVKIISSDAPKLFHIELNFPFSIQNLEILLNCVITSNVAV